MAPTDKARSPKRVVFQDEAENSDEESLPLKDIRDRKLEINIAGTIKNLKELDWSKVVWRNVILFALLHIFSGYGLYIALTSAKWLTILFAVLVYTATTLSNTVGTHRLWAHRTYKANFPLRLLLAFIQTASFQNDIYEWSRDHRLHHKYSETNADPHSAKRGFFFSHMGWLMYRKHPDTIKMGEKLDLSDLERDSIVMFQRRYYKWLVIVCCFVLPSVTPWYFWAESFYSAFLVCGLLRYLVSLHVAWTVNSLAHWTGIKPYDKNIYPVQIKLVSALGMGEGWHNYHHTFPWDYRTAEFKGLSNFNLSTNVIDIFTAIGWAWDRKTVSTEAIFRTVKKTGDGSHHSVIKKTK